MAVTAILLAASPAVPARADDLKTYPLTLQDHKFSPAGITIPPDTRVRIEVTNRDTTTAELESYDLKFEKIIVPGGKAAVFAGPAHPGTYKFFDDYHPDAVGIVTVKAP